MYQRYKRHLLVIHNARHCLPIQIVMMPTYKSKPQASWWKLSTADPRRRGFTEATCRHTLFGKTIRVSCSWPPRKKQGNLRPPSVTVFVPCESEESSESYGRPSRSNADQTALVERVDGFFAMPSDLTDNNHCATARHGNCQWKRTRLRSPS